VGITLVPLFKNFGTVYQAHGAVTASITPPMVVAILLGCTWKRYTPAAAFWTLVGGTTAMFLSIRFPEIITPFAQGVEMKGEGLKAFGYMRACYGVSVSLAIGLVVTIFSRPKPKNELIGLVWGTEREAALDFKGVDTGTLAGYDPGAGCIKKFMEVFEYESEEDDSKVFMSSGDLALLSASQGDLLYCSHRFPLFGGLRSMKASAGLLPDGDNHPSGRIGIPREAMDAARFSPGQRISVERIL
jgi:SSS family solute:Na+ symporter